MYAINTPFPQFFDNTGSPLSAGKIYIGAVGLDPETNPVPVYFDAAGTIPAVQPIPTLNGYPARNGAPAQLFIAQDYSITVRNKRGVLVLSALASEQDTLSLAKTSGASKVGYLQQGTGAVPRTVQDKLRETVNAADFGAKGDGVTDDTAAIQAAANFVGYGGTINFNRGTFFVSTTINLRGATKLLGQGIGATTILRTGDFGDTFVCGTAASQSEPARSCEFRKIEFRHSLPYIANGTTLPNKATQGAHLRLYGAQEAVIKDCWFTRLPYGVVSEGGSWVKVENCQFVGVFDKLQPALQEGIAQLWAHYSTVHGNPTTWIVKGCNFLGATFMRDVVYDVTSGTRVINRIDTIGSQFGFLMDGMEDLDCSGNYFGGHSSAEAAMANSPGGSIIDIRIAKNFFDGISRGAGVLIAPETPNAVALAVGIEGNVFTDNYRGVLVVRNIGSGTPSTYNLTIRGNQFLSGIGSQIVLGGARGFVVSDNLITDYNKHHVTATDGAFIYAVLPNDLSSGGLVTDNVIGGGGNAMANGDTVNFCYGGVSTDLAEVVVKNNHYLGIRTGSLYRVGTVADENQRVLTASGNYQCTPADSFIGVNKTANEATAINLPVTPPAGREITIKDLKGNAATQQIIVGTSDGTLIDGAASRNISTAYGGTTLRFTGSNWAVK